MSLTNQPVSSRDACAARWRGRGVSPNRVWPPSRLAHPAGRGYAACRTYRCCRPPTSRIGKPFPRSVPNRCPTQAQQAAPSAPALAVNYRVPSSSPWSCSGCSGLSLLSRMSPVRTCQKRRVEPPSLRRAGPRHASLRPGDRGRDRRDFYPRSVKPAPTRTFLVNRPRRHPVTRAHFRL